MPDNVDEDLIEATIRRVAEARAAREGESGPDEGIEDDSERPGPSPLNFLADPDQPTADSAMAMDGEIDGGDAGGNSGSPSGPDEDAIAATIARVQAQKAAADAAAKSIDAIPARSAPDEDAIAATIRRVQAQKAAQELRYDDDEDKQPATPEPARRDEDAPQVAAASTAEYADDIETFEPVSEVSANDDAIARIERNLREAHHAIAGLTARIEALEQAGSQAPRRPQVAALTGTDNDAPPRPLQPTFGSAPRPAIVRDAFPPERAALAEQLPAPDAIDTRPLPEPLPPIHVESRRGLDLLPRTYRITVEDKRRGVDLVPLHRALLSMDGVRDMSLLSYNNGVAIVSLETTGDLDGDELGNYVARAMSRAAKVEQHNEHTFVVKLAED